MLPLEATCCVTTPLSREDVELWPEQSVIMIKQKTIRSQLQVYCTLALASSSAFPVLDSIADSKDGKDCAGKGKSRGRPATACTPDSIQRVSDLILENRRISFHKLENATGLSRGTLHTDYSNMTMRGHMAVGRPLPPWVLTVLPHPSYSPDLAPSDYALFDAMKDVMRGKTFTSNDELQAVVQQ
ncbi:uncharacterized protein LOC111867376 [Cryptotermes secundus]|uniref:uncharacterized protein LOC111867376 n=1 Tax=Cryptotermes secundus TaxID=105785 RepID=UPI000CD7DC89|nr:uncharacterized protein LOC111867376 [Cryptotermes secundus]